MNAEEFENNDQDRDPQESNAEVNSCDNFIVGWGYELMEAFGLTAENRPIIKLNPDNVPEEFRVLIPYAEEWGISDDLIRGDVISKASPEALRDLVVTISQHQDAIGKWLAGPEAYSDIQTEEYYVFSALMMAFDEARYSM